MILRVGHFIHSISFTEFYAFKNSSQIYMIPTMSLQNTYYLLSFIINSLRITNSFSFENILQNFLKIVKISIFYLILTIICLILNIDVHTSSNPVIDIVLILESPKSDPRLDNFKQS